MIRVMTTGASKHRAETLRVVALNAMAALGLSLVMGLALSRARVRGLRGEGGG